MFHVYNVHTQAPDSTMGDQFLSFQGILAP